MNEILKAACIQLNNKPDRRENTIIATNLIREAASAGAQLIATPEYTCQMVAVGGTSRLDGAQMEEGHELLHHYRDLAAELGKWLIIGSLGVKVTDEKLANRSYLINGNGDIVAKYDKIHLFNVDLPDGQIFRESRVCVPGDKAVVGKTPWGGIGLSICFDVRFASLFRKMAQAGARILSIPAAYSIPTGSTTWEIFTRTRAAETGSFVLASAQCGNHEGNRETWGHSMIIGPLGEILAERKENTPGIIMADLDLAASDRARKNVPSLKQDREFSLESF